jgi:hypothetical protein
VGDSQERELKGRLDLTCGLREVLEEWMYIELMSDLDAHRPNHSFHPLSLSCSHESTVLKDLHIRGG